jgi:glycine/D-amino acid oxidase-like deaminating enzyme
MISEAPPYPGRAWWLAEADAVDAGGECPSLSEDIDADVVIVGGGYTGLWTANALLELEPRTRVVVLERDVCGSGPSGRNGGFCGGYWSSLDALVELFGDERALDLALAAERTVDEVEEFCARHAVDAWFVRAGDLGVATAPAQAGRWRGAVETTRRLGVADRLVELGPADVAERIRLPYRGGGILSPEEATVQPARLALGLRRAVLAQGARIFERTAVRRLRAGPPLVAETQNGMVRAEHAVLAANAWLAALPAFHARLTVRGTYMVMTAPAPERLAEIGWTGGESVWNFRSALNYLRTTRDGRIAFGTGAMQPGLARRVGPDFEWHRGFVAEVASQFRAMFPSFANVPLEAGWGGPIDVSGAHLPFVGRSAGGNVHHAAGFTGNGVGPCRLVGQILARRVLGRHDELTRLPIVDFEPKRFPREPLRSAGALVVNSAVLRLDRAEDTGRRAGRLTGLVARLPRRLGYNLGP